MWYLYRIIILFLVIHNVHAKGKNTTNKSPLSRKFKLVSLLNCRVSSYPGEKYYDYNIYARKINRTNTVLNSNFTVYKRYGPVTLDFLAYQLQANSARDLIFKVERMGCNKYLMNQLLALLNVHLDEHCYTKPGNYFIKNVNVEIFSWLFTSAMVGAGKYSYDIIFNSSRGPEVCTRINLDIS